MSDFAYFQEQDAQAVAAKNTAAGFRTVFIFQDSENTVFR